MTTLPLCDPHFHMWDLDARPNPNLGPEAEELLRSYRAADYDADAATLPPRLNLVSRVHVETVVGQMEGGPVVDTVSETEWVSAQLEPTQAERPSYLVAYLNLAGDPAAAQRTLERHIEASSSRLRGVRMILNHHPENPDLTWPQVAGGELMQTPRFREGLERLAGRNLAFDLSCNPHQIPGAVRVLADFPGLRVVANHLGFLHDGEDDAHEELWRDGIQGLAALPNIDIKLSMLWFARAGFHSDPGKRAKVRDLVREVIDVFGPERCMFASNYPVDKLRGISFAALYGLFLEWTQDLAEDELRTLFHDTAARAYNLD